VLLKTFFGQYFLNFKYVVVDERGHTKNVVLAKTALAIQDIGKIVVYFWCMGR